MDLTQMMVWIVAANTIITFGTSIYNLMSARATKALKAIEGLEAKISKIADDRQLFGEAINARFQLAESRMLRLEADMEHMPDRDQAHQAQQQVHRLELAIEKLTGKMETLDERLKPVAATTARLQNYLMEQGAEK